MTPRVVEVEAHEHRRALRVAALFFLGALLIQTAWVLALPPFRGIDEFDHAYRAAAVARGEWRPTPVPAAHGRGDLLTVPRDIVEAAAPVCRSYAYTGPDNCRVVDSAGGGLVHVASAAARYHPAFYFIVGTPARAFDGATALNVMRMVSAVLCAALIGYTAWVLARFGSSRWLLAGLIVVLTPVLIYSTAVAAPNGLEMCAALLVWCVLLLLPYQPSHGQRALIVAATIGAVPLVTVRTMGPLWLALIVATSVAVPSWAQLTALLRARRHALTVASGVVGTAGLASVWWILSADPNRLEASETFANPVANTLAQLPLWLLQSIAAFPIRNQQAPTVVYAACGITIAALLAIAAARAPGRMRWMLVVVALAAVTAPVTLTLATYSVAGPIWQGRYGYPYAMGLLILAALCIALRPPQHRLWRAAAAILGVVVGGAHAVSIVHVHLGELAHSPLAGDESWLTAPTWFLAVLAATGCAAWLAGCRLVPWGDGAQGAGETIAPETPDPLSESMSGMLITKR